MMRDFRLLEISSEPDIPESTDKYDEDELQPSQCEC